MPTISKNFIKELIEAFKNQPALWLIKSKKYRNKQQKDKSWNILLKKYKQLDEDATVDHVKRKINSLRSGYRRELRNIRKSEKCGADYIPSLWYFNLLEFLRDQEEQMELLTASDDFTENEEAEMVTPPPTTKRKLKEISCETPPPTTKWKHNGTDFLQKAVEHLENSKIQHERDEADIFGEGWAMLYRKLRGDQQIYAKRLIDEALLEAQMGHLSYYSNINVVAP